MFEIEDTRYRAAVEEAVAKKAQLEAKLLYAKNSFERYNRLLASKSVSMDTVENAKSTMHALEAEIQSANAAITVAKDDLNYTRLTAPITGRTGRVTFSTGNYITPTSGSLVTITGIDEVYVKFPISERFPFPVRHPGKYEERRPCVRQPRQRQGIRPAGQNFS